MQTRLATPSTSGASTSSEGKTPKARFLWDTGAASPAIDKFAERPRSRPFTRFQSPSWFRLAHSHDGLAKVFSIEHADEGFRGVFQTMCDVFAVTDVAVRD